MKKHFQMGIFCGNIAPPDLHSSNSFLWLKFFSDDMISGRGFSAVATAEDPLCGSLVPLNVTSEEEILQSPGYGSAYPLGVTCQWVLAGPDWYERILIRVITMDLENSTACQKDRLEFSDVGGRAPVNQVAVTKKITSCPGIQVGEGPLVLSSERSRTNDFHWRTVRCRWFRI